MTHFLIYNSDGDTIVQEIDPKTFLKNLENESWEFFEALPELN